MSRGSLIKVHFSPGCLKKAICVPEVSIFFYMPSNILGHFLWFELSYQVMFQKTEKKKKKVKILIYRAFLFIYYLLKVDALVFFAMPSSAIHKHTHTYGSIKQHLFIVLC